MKRIILLLLFLAACSSVEVPPDPTVPGQTSAGMAIGGISIGAFPSWAAPLKYTDITPTVVSSGNSVKITVERPTSDSRKLYVYATMYEFDREYNMWRSRFSEASQSGELKANKWHINKAVFSVPVNSQKFPAGLNYVVVYWCADNGKDSSGRQMWDCNGAKWLLGAFEQIGVCGDNVISSQEVCDPPGKLCNQLTGVVQNGSSLITASQSGKQSVVGSQTSIGSSGVTTQYVCANDCKSCVPSQVQIPVCGNKLLEKGEDCEPPYNPASALPSTSAIYECTMFNSTVKGVKGYCSQNCTCIPPTSGEPPGTQYVCGNNITEPGEECDGSSSAPLNSLCINCAIICDVGFVKQGNQCVPQSSGSSFICPPSWVDTTGAEASFFLGLLNPWQYNIMQLNAAGQPKLFASVYLVNPFGPATATNLKVIFASEPQRDLFGTLISSQHNYPMRDGLLFESNPFASGKADYLLLTLKSKTSNKVTICWKAANDYPVNKPTVT